VYEKNLKKRGNVGHDPMYLWVLLVEEIGVHVDNHRSSSSHRQTLSHKVVSSTPCNTQDSYFSGDRHWLHR